MGMFSFRWSPCSHSVLLSTSVYNYFGATQNYVQKFEVKEDKESYLVCNDVAFTWRTNDMTLLLK